VSFGLLKSQASPIQGFCVDRAYVKSCRKTITLKYMKNIQLKVTVELLYTVMYISQHCILYSDMHLSQFINKHETGHR